MSERITQVNQNDIICGRRGVALKHPGNLAYRKVVGLNKELYATCVKTEKLRISKSIVAAMREVGGRFLQREDGGTSETLDEKDAHGNPVVYVDIGDKRAVEKTSQALREGQPKLLRQMAQRAQRRAIAEAQGRSAAASYVDASHHVSPRLSPAPSASYGYTTYASQPIPRRRSVTPLPLPPLPPLAPPSSWALPELLSRLDTSELLMLALLSRR